jgi:hypothetical protein
MTAWYLTPRGHRADGNTLGDGGEKSGSSVTDSKWQDRDCHGGITSYFRPIVPVFLYQHCSRSLSRVLDAGGGSSGMPPPSRTGITDISRRSTSPSTSKLRNSSPPPKIAMSFPGFPRKSATAS